MRRKPMIHTLEETRQRRAAQSARAILRVTDSLMLDSHVNRKANLFNWAERILTANWDRVDRAPDKPALAQSFPRIARAILA